MGLVTRDSEVRKHALAGSRIYFTPSVQRRGFKHGRKNTHWVTEGYESCFHVIECYARMRIRGKKDIFECLNRHRQDLSRVDSSNSLMMVIQEKLSSGFLLTCESSPIWHVLVRRQACLENVLEG